LASGQQLGMDKGSTGSVAGTSPHKCALVTVPNPALVELQHITVIKSTIVWAGRGYDPPPPERSQPLTGGRFPRCIRIDACITAFLGIRYGLGSKDYVIYKGLRPAIHAAANWPLLRRPTSCRGSTKRKKKNNGANYSLQQRVHCAP